MKKNLERVKYNQQAYPRVSLLHLFLLEKVYSVKVLNNKSNSQMLFLQRFPVIQKQTHLNHCQTDSFLTLHIDPKNRPEEHKQGTFNTENISIKNSPNLFIIKIQSLRSMKKVKMHSIFRYVQEIKKKQKIKNQKTLQLIVYQKCIPQKLFRARRQKPQFNYQLTLHRKEDIEEDQVQQPVQKITNSIRMNQSNWKGLYQSKTGVFFSVYEFVQRYFLSLYQYSILATIVIEYLSLLMTEQKKINVWLDCDPGFDDLFAIILIVGHPRINVLGISTSPGNTTLEHTTQNALDLLYNLNKSHIPVVRGSSKPFTQSLDYAFHMHGSNGLCGVQLKKSDKVAIIQKGFDKIHQLIMNAPGKVNFVNTGSLTNLALLLHAYDDLKGKLQQISIMGGAIGKGNITPASEFNIFFDPIAAREVFSYGIPLTMQVLQLTHTAQATQDIINKLSQHKSDIGVKIVQLLKKFQHNYLVLQGFEFPPLHDPCAVYFLLEPQQFVIENAQVIIDTYPISFGRTNINFSSKNPNAQVCTKLNVKKFWEVMLSAYTNVVPK